MKKLKFAIIATIVLPLMLANGVQAHEGEEMKLNLTATENEQMPDHHAIVHPFLSHLGLPEGLGETSLRTSYVRSVTDGKGSNDFGFHVETSLWDGVGIHLRNDSMQNNARTEIMLQSALWRDSTKLSGVGAFVEVEFPTGEATANELKWALGVSGRWIVIPYFSLDGDLHYKIADKMSEWETAFVYKLTDTFFPVIELRGETSPDESMVSALGAIKLKIGENRVIGMGLQYPLTTAREFDRQLYVQVDLGFH